MKALNPPWRSKPKRMRSDEDSEAKADQAATEIVELVEQKMSNLPSHERATQQSLEALTLPDTDVSDIPAHILAESREMSNEVTPPVNLFFHDEGERQDGDCGPAALIILRILSDGPQTQSTGVTPNVPSHLTVCHDAPTAPDIA